MTKMKEQKFFRGDLVQIADDLGASMRHFDKGCQAIVIGTYAEICSDDNDVDNYKLYILPSRGSVAWYHTHQLTLIEPNRYDLLPKNDRTRLNWEAQQARDGEWGLAVKEKFKITYSDRLAALWKESFKRATKETQNDTTGNSNTDTGRDVRGGLASGNPRRSDLG
jgi:hypothetical protein